MKAKNHSLLVGMGLCIATGILLWFLVRQNTQSSSQNILPDLLFTVGSVILVGGLISLLNDMHTFTSASHSFRVFHELFRGKQKSAEHNMDDLLSKESEPPKRHSPIYILTALCLIGISTLFSFL